MTDRPSPKQDDPTPGERRVLDYMAPRNDRRYLSAETWRLAAGIGLTAAGVIGWVLVTLMSIIRIYSGPGTPPPDFVTPLVTGAGILGVLLATALVLWMRHRSLSFVKGSLIGLGLAVLIAGACFAAMQ